MCGRAYVMLCQCGCRLRNQTFLGNKSRIGRPSPLPRRRGSARLEKMVDAAERETYEYEEFMTE